MARLYTWGILSACDLNVAFRSTDVFDEFFNASAITHIPCHGLFHHSLTKPLGEFPKSRHSQIPFKTQIDFIRSLKVRSNVKCAKQVDYLTRTIRLGNADSKSIISNSHGMLYDTVPHWLHYLPQNFTNIASMSALDQEFSKCFFSRANLSFSHFVATDLAQIIIVNRFLPQDVPIIMPWLTSWQKSLLAFFGIIRRVITFRESCKTHQFLSVSFRNSYALEDLCEYEGLSYCRAAAQSLLKTTNHTISNSDRPIVWLGRHLYEASRGLKPRIENLRDMVPIMKMHSVVYIDPSAHTLDFVANLVNSAALVISESGSHFINYLLFSNPNTPIIQLSPYGTLSPTWSYYNVNNMQWYHPVISQLYFYVGNNPIQTHRQYGSPWNIPSKYDPFGLSCLISDLLSV